MCGIIGIHGPDSVAKDIYYALMALQHRGQSSVGMISFDGNIYPEKEAGLVPTLLKQQNSVDRFVEGHPGPIGIGHTRYSTSGKDTEKDLKRNAQPEYLVNPFIATCHNGNIYNGTEVLATVNRAPRTACDIQYLLLPMAGEIPPYPEINFDTIVEAGEKTMARLRGSYSSLFLTAGRSRPYLVAMTDPYKIRPLVMGRQNDTWYIASESVVLRRMGIKEFEDVEAGSVVTVTPGEDRPRTKRIRKKKKCPCMFEYIYFSDPISWIEKISVHHVRVSLGRVLARRHPCNADIVVPVPESGRRYAIGFANESGIPIEEGLKKNRKERAFIMQTQAQRDVYADRAISAIDAALDGMDVVILDDSLIRGTNITRVIRKLRDAGARKVHVRIGCPPIIAPCYLGIDMRSKNEFIAFDTERNEVRDWEEIAERIDADSLAYSDISDLKTAIVGDREDMDICTGCLNIPDGYPPDMREDVRMLFEMDMGGSRSYEIVDV